MDESRRRLLHFGLASAAAGLAAPVEALAKARHRAHHPALRKASHLHAAHGHAAHGPHGRQIARNGRHPHEARDAFHPVKQASIDLGDAPRRVKFHNLHTDEKLDAVYWEGGQYVPDALHAVNHVLRDFRTGDVHAMDPGLLDLLVALSTKTETNAPFHVISGYRSPKTNAMLRAEGGAETGVARKSLHLEGQAIDIRLPDVQLAHLHAAALSLGRGGVGYYPVSDFVHVDVGAVRQWGGV